MTFQDNGVWLSPAPAVDPGWVFTYVPTLSDSSALDSDLITFNTLTDEFSVFTDQQSKAGEYEIAYEKEAQFGDLAGSIVTV